MITTNQINEAAYNYMLTINKETELDDLDAFNIQQAFYNGARWASELEEIPIEKEDLSLDTLKYIKFAFDIYSDSSTRCFGYNYLCTKINELENKGL